MGCNYFARIIPSKGRKDELHKAIDVNDISLVKHLVDELYGESHMNWDTHDIEGGIVHLGKRSCGWKFLWNPNIYLVRNGYSEWTTHQDGHRSSKWIPEPDSIEYLYPLTKEGIKAFIDRDDIEIYDEYDDKQDKEEFWNMALKWGEFEGWDAGTYEAEHPSNFPYCHSSDLVEVLKREGYKFTSPSCSDFYSDGLRFSTSTDFS